MSVQKIRVQYDTRNNKGCPMCGSLKIEAKKELFSRKQYIQCSKCKYEWFPDTKKAR